MYSLYLPWVLVCVLVYILYRSHCCPQPAHYRDRRLVTSTDDGESAQRRVPFQLNVEYYMYIIPRFEKRTVAADEIWSYCGIVDL